MDQTRAISAPRRRAEILRRRLAASVFVLSVAGSAGLLVTDVAAAQDEVSLQPPGQEGYYRRDEEIRLGLPGDALGAESRLAFELDEYDVSAFVEVSGGTATLRLPIPHELGLHTLRVVDFRADGNLVALGVFPFEVRASRRFRERSLTGQLDVTLSQRMADHQLVAPPRRGLLRGAADLRGRLGGDDWSFAAHSPILFDRNAAPPGIFDGNAVLPGGGAGEIRDWDLGAFLVEGKRGPGRLRLGHHAPAPPGLILENFQRRGASASLELAPLNSSLTAFSLRSEPITGFREGLGLHARSHRVSGVTLEGQPIAIPDGVLDLAATYLHGRSGPAEAASLTHAGLQLGESGSAWSVRADSLLFGERLRLRGEYARTRFDPFVDLAGRAERDDAWSVLIAVRPWPQLLLAEHPLTAQLEVEFREVGRLFRSIGNPGAPTDRYLQQVSLSSNWAGFNGRFSFARERDNVDDLDFLPRFRTDLFDGQLGFSPVFRTPPEGWFRKLLGQPFVQANWSRERLKPTHSPTAREVVGAAILARSQTTITNDQGAVIDTFSGAAFLDPTASVFGTQALVSSGRFFDPFLGLPEFVFSDRWFRTASLSMGSSYERAAISLSHTMLLFEDNTRQQPDTRSDLTALNGTLLLGTRGSLGLSVQHQREKHEDVGYEQTMWLGSMHLAGKLVPERLDGSLQASIARSRDSISSLDSRFSVISGRLDWHALQARPQRPGLTLSLLSSWTDLEDSVNRAASTETFQVFLQAELRWPIQWQ